MSERRLSNVRSCRGCPDRRNGCKHGCEDFAVRRILDALSLPERRAQVQLHFDLKGIMIADQLKHARKNNSSRRR